MILKRNNQPNMGQRFFTSLSGDHGAPFQVFPSFVTTPNANLAKILQLGFMDYLFRINPFLSLAFSFNNGFTHYPLLVTHFLSTAFLF